MTGIMDYPLLGFASFELFNEELFAERDDVITNRFEFQTMIGATGRERTSMIDHRTDRTYMSDALTYVVIKQFLLLAAVPVYTLAKMTYQIAITAFHFVLNEIGVMCATFYTVTSCSLEEGGLYEAGDKALQDLKNDLYEIARSPIYAMALECAALKGVLESVFVDWSKAFEAKVIFADIEKNWHNGAVHNRGLQDYLVGRIAFSEIKTTYVAQCFQPFRLSFALGPERFRRIEQLLGRTSVAT